MNSPESETASLVITLSYGLIFFSFSPALSASGRSGICDCWAGDDPHARRNAVLIVASANATTDFIAEGPKWLMSENCESKYKDARPAIGEGTAWLGRLWCIVWPVGLGAGSGRLATRCHGGRR